MAVKTSVLLGAFFDATAAFAILGPPCEVFEKTRIRSFVGTNDGMIKDDDGKIATLKNQKSPENSEKVG